MQLKAYQKDVHKLKNDSQAFQKTLKYTEEMEIKYQKHVKALLDQIKFKSIENKEYLGVIKNYEKITENYDKQLGKISTNKKPKI